MSATCLTLLKDSLCAHKIIVVASFKSTYFEGSVKLTFEINCRDYVTSFYNSKNKFLCLDFSEGPSQIYEITYIQYLNMVIFKRP